MFALLNFLTVLALLQGQPAHASSGKGGWIGGADELAFDAEAAWFTGQKAGQKAIRYCLNASPEFPISILEVAPMIERGFAAWIAYYKATRLESHQTSNIDTFFATQVAAMAECDGSQDLRFELGTTAPEIDEAKKKFRGPVGISEKAAQQGDDLRYGSWAKHSFIWINSSFYSEGDSAGVKAKKLEIFLRHEIGHVFGNGHVPGTIMDVGLDSLMNNTRPDVGGRRPTLDLLLKIDQEAMLYLCGECDEWAFEKTYLLGALSKDALRGDVIRRKVFGMPGDLMGDRTEAIAPYKHLAKASPCLMLDEGCSSPIKKSKIRLSRTAEGRFKVKWQVEGKPEYTLELGKPYDSLESIAKEQVFQRVVARDYQIASGYPRRSWVFMFKVKVKGIKKELQMKVHLNSGDRQFMLYSEDPEGYGGWYLLGSDGRGDE